MKYREKRYTMGITMMKLYVTNKQYLCINFRDILNFTLFSQLQEQGFKKLGTIFQARVSLHSVTYQTFVSSIELFYLTLQIG